jgi:K+-sensing histidine kinase KdpD
VQRILKAANREKRLVEDLLRVSRVEAGHASVRRQGLPRIEVVARAAETARASYPDQLIDITRPPGLRAVADRTYAEQVLINLLDNTAKYGLKRLVEVVWTAEDGIAVVRVRDHGPGVPQEGRHLLFTRFGRIPGSGMRSGHVDTGLGLCSHATRLAWRAAKSCWRRTAA